MPIHGLLGRQPAGEGCRVVSMSVLVLLAILSAILFDYWYKYHRYFSSAFAVSIGDTFGANLS